MPELDRGLRVCALYPELMNIYADRGNLLLLERRCRWRGIDFSLTASDIGDTLDPEAADLYYIGGGQDRGGVILAVCGGYQLLGHSYQLGDEELPGISLVDAVTVRADGPRLIGNVAIEVELTAGRRQVLAGFENHGGRTRLGPGAEPLGRVLSGHGNNGRDRHEGVRRGNVIGTYLHGPLLPKNTWFADWLVATALGIEDGLAPLEDELEDAAHADACRAAGV